MLGSFVDLSPGEFVARSREFDCEEDASLSGWEIWSGLDLLDTGTWFLESTGGGCHAYECRLCDGSWVVVSDSEGPLSSYGDADDFGSGGVMVGLFGDREQMMTGEGVYFVRAFRLGDDRETAIVEAVGDVLSRVGVSFLGVDWEMVRGLVGA